MGGSGSLILITEYSMTTRVINQNLNYLQLYIEQILSDEEESSGKQYNVLVSTSGDTGSAIASAFSEVEDIQVTILYPEGRISDVQELQLTTFQQNVTAYALDGTFDDC